MRGCSIEGEKMVASGWSSGCAGLLDRRREEAASGGSSPSAGMLDCERGEAASGGNPRCEWQLDY